MKVAVYWNLHTHMFSIRALEGPSKGRVIAHASALSLADVTTKVSKAGRERVLRERKKNVHAFVIGRLAGYSGTPVEGRLNDNLRFTDMGLARCRALSLSHSRLLYNPYHSDRFEVQDVLGPRWEFTGAKYAYCSTLTHNDFPAPIIGVVEG